MELSWFPFSVVATLLFGVAMAFYKLPSTKNHNRFATAFWSFLVPAILALIFFYLYLPLSTSAMMWTALLWGITFTCIVLLQMYALSHVDTNVLFPITTTASRDSAESIRSVAPYLGISEIELSEQLQNIEFKNIERGFDSAIAETKRILNL